MHFSRTFREHIQHNVVGYVALFCFAVGGTAMAVNAPRNTVVSRSIKNGNVKLADLAANSVDSSKVVDNSLTGADIDEAGLNLSGLQARVSGACAAGEAISAVAADGSVSCEADDTGSATGAAGGDLTGSYPNPSIAANAVNGGKVQDNSLGGDDIQESSLGAVPTATDASSLGGFAAGDFVTSLFTGPTSASDHATTRTSDLENMFFHSGGNFDATCSPGVLVGMDYDNVSGINQQVSIMSLNRNGGTVTSTQSGAVVANGGNATVGLAADSFQATVLIGVASNSDTDALEIAGFEDGVNCYFQFRAMG